MSKLVWALSYAWDEHFIGLVLMGAAFCGIVTFGLLEVCL